MKKIMKAIGGVIVLMMAVMMLTGMVMASDDDNSLYDLGITTEGATCEPAFSYDVWECTVTVPAGTKELSLSPITSSESATIADISGTTLDADGNGTVYITVRSANGSDFTYTVHVESDGMVAPTVEVQTEAPQTEAPQPVTEAETEPQTEDSRYVKVDKNTIQEAENTITGLKAEIVQYKENLGLYTKVVYGLIALAVIMLFIIINMSIRRRDLKLELKEYKSLGYGAPNMKKAQPMQARPQQPMPVQAQVPAQQRNVRPAQGQPAGGLDVMPQTSKKAQVMPEYQNAAPAQMSQPMQEQPALSAKEAKRAQKAAQKEAAAAEKAAQKQAAAAEKAAKKEAAAAAKAAEQEAAQRAAQQKAIQEAAMAPKTPAPQAPAAKNDVEVNMIDL